MRKKKKNESGVNVFYLSEKRTNKDTYWTQEMRIVG